MRMRIYKLFAAALLVLLCVNLLPGAACAAAADSGSASILLEINRTGEYPANSYGVVIEAVEPSNPMPLNPARTYSDDAKTDPFKAADVFSIAYNEPGVYRLYTVRQLAQYSTLTNMRYDARIWRVTVSVSYDDNGRLTAVPTIRENESAPKADGIVFNNSYDPTFRFKELTVKKVWDDDGYKSRPTSVKIQLLHNGMVYDTVTLNARNEWTYTWPRLLFDGDNTWEINESPKPYRYRVSYTSNFTNDYETYYGDRDQHLPPRQPYPDRAAQLAHLRLRRIGIALVVIGVVRSKRGRTIMRKRRASPFFNNRNSAACGGTVPITIIVWTAAAPVGRRTACSAACRRR